MNDKLFACKAAEDLEFDSKQDNMMIASLHLDIMDPCLIGWLGCRRHIWATELHLNPAAALDLIIQASWPQ